MSADGFRSPHFILFVVVVVMTFVLMVVLYVVPTLEEEKNYKYNKSGTFGLVVVSAFFSILAGGAAYMLTYPAVEHLSNKFS